MTIEVESPEDWWDVEALYDLCFSPGRSALSSYRLRDGVAPIAPLCLVARDDLNIVTGAIRFWPILIDDHQALLLGPIAVHPTHQGEGLGGALMREGLDRARDFARPVLLVGDAPYYARFGFEKLTGVEMPPPTNPDRILGFGTWNGIEGRVRRAEHD